MTRARRAVFVGVLAAAAFLCACPAPETAPSGGLRVICRPETASVYVNEVYRGQARVLGSGPARLQPGRYRVEVAAEGHFPHYQEVSVDRDVVTLRVTLRPRPE